MGDLLLQDVPREGEILELTYRLATPSQTHLEMTVSADGVERRLRFSGPRVVQFQSEMPEVLRGLEVQDIRDRNIGDLTLWVSVGGGAVTFWARSVSDITARKPERKVHAEPAPDLEADHIRELGSAAVPRASFRYRSPSRGGPLRHFSVSTRPFVRR